MNSQVSMPTASWLRTLKPFALNTLSKQIRAEVRRREQHTRTDLLSKIASLLATSGLTWEDVFDTAAPADFDPTARRRKSSASTKVLEPKYRNPNKLEQTWSGRGRPPAWVKAHLSTGRSLEALLAAGQYAARPI